MARAPIGAVIMVCAGFSLAGCVEGTAPLAKPADETGTAGVARAATSVRLVERDTEAPQVFQTSDSALWDGRPSLGGVWVASPDAVDPERVILRNPSNGKFVIGALFRRERLNPGPTLQISSDAAAALGILAGQPTEISVTALRREEVPDGPAADPGKPLLDAAEAVETDAIADAATAAIARATPAAAPAPSAAPAAIVTAAAAPVPSETGPGTETAEAAPAPERKKWRLFGRKPTDEAAPTGETAAIETAAVEASVLPAAAGAPAAQPAVQPATAPKPVAERAAAAKPAAPAARGGMIQIGIFSVEANARRAEGMLSKAGVPARVLTETSQGKTFWRVVADAAADRSATLTKVKAAGFGDAYFVTR